MQESERNVERQELYQRYIDAHSPSKLRPWYAQVQNKNVAKFIVALEDSHFKEQVNFDPITIDIPKRPGIIDLIRSWFNRKDSEFSKDLRARKDLWHEIDSCRAKHDNTEVFTELQNIDTFITAKKQLQQAQQELERLDDNSNRSNITMTETQASDLSRAIQKVWSCKQRILEITDQEGRINQQTVKIPDEIIRTYQDEQKTIQSILESKDMHLSDKSKEALKIRNSWLTQKLQPKEQEGPDKEQELQPKEQEGPDKEQELPPKAPEEQSDEQGLRKKSFQELVGQQNTITTAQLHARINKYNEEHQQGGVRTTNYY